MSVERSSTHQHNIQNSNEHLNLLRNGSPSSHLSSNENVRNSVESAGGSSGYGTGVESIHTQPISYVLSPRIIGYCAECGLRITNLADACHALGYLYHNNCFVCCCCKRSLRGRSFYKDQDKVYCDEDYLYCGFQQTVEKCTACGHIITDTILIALGNTYHPGCFRCCICSKCLDGQQFTVDSKKNNIYCLTDYYLVYGSLCAVCGLVITPEKGSDEVKRIIAMDKEFHVDCYRCLDCKRLLGDEPDQRCYPFNEPDAEDSGRSVQRLLCLNCHLQRIGAIPATSASSMAYPGFSKSSSSATTPLTRHTGLNSGPSQGLYNTQPNNHSSSSSNADAFVNSRGTKINLMNYMGDRGSFGPNGSARKRPDTSVTIPLVKNFANNKGLSNSFLLKSDLSNMLHNCPTSKSENVNIN